MYLCSNSEAAGTGCTDAEIVLPDGGQIVSNSERRLTQKTTARTTPDSGAHEEEGQPAERGEKEQDTKATE